LSQKDNRDLLIPESFGSFVDTVYNHTLHTFKTIRNRVCYPGVGCLLIALRSSSRLPLYN